MADVFPIPKSKKKTPHINSRVDVCVKSSHKFATARKVLVAEAAMLGAFATALVAVSSPDKMYTGHIFMCM